LADFYDDPPLPGDYVVSPDGVRLVRPYPFDFACHVKKRHVGADVVRMFAEEFPARPRRYYERAFELGLLRVETAAKNAKNAVPEPSERPSGGTRRRSSSTSRPADAFPGGGGASNDGVGTSSERTASEQRRQSLSSDLRPLRPGERVRHALHRHEPPTVCPRVEVVAATASVVAVHKPATVPAHPTGQYRKNTVLGVLAAERPDLGRLFPVHRLDKNVSGLLLLARDGESATRMCEEVARREVRKEYLALVRVFGPERERESESESESSFESSFLATVAKRWGTPPAPGDADGEENADGGEEERDERERSSSDRRSREGVAFLPDGKIVVTASLAYDPRARLATCHPPVQPECGGGSESGRREGRREGPPSGGTEEEGRGTSDEGLVGAKAAETSFRDVTRRLPPAARAKLPRGVALVKCEPRTGRTHQIRAHLAFLGAPIANDAKYGGERAYGEYGASARASPRGGVGRSPPGWSPPGWSLERVARVRAFVEETRCFAADDAEAAEKAAGRWPLCAHCPRMAHRGGEAGDDPDLEAIWLHCARYSGRGWRFRCPDPPWLPSGEEPGIGEEAPGGARSFCDALEEEEEARDGSATRAGNEQSGGR
jgi:23S rRNA-/tRNA-specific pseudouridylate synthase